MNKRINTLFLTAVTLSCFSSGEGADFHWKFSPKNQNHECGLIKVLSLPEMSDEMLGQVLQGILPHIVVEFSEGDAFPFTLFLGGDLVDLVEITESAKLLRVKKTFYVRVVKEEVLFSRDCMNWRPFLEFTTGQIGLSLYPEGDTISIGFRAELNERE